MINCYFMHDDIMHLSVITSPNQPKRALFGNTLFSVSRLGASLHFQAAAVEVQYV